MRPIVKQEPGAGGAQEAAWEREVRRRGGNMGEEGAGAELLRANAEAQALALQGMERERAVGEQLNAEAEANVCNLTAAMPYKRMRPIVVKQEPGADGAQEAAWETQREGRRRRGDMGEEG